jgi:hypothetical protein
MEKAVQKCSEPDQHSGNSRPEPYGKQDPDSGRYGLKHNFGGRGALPDSHYCLSQQIEAASHAREQKPKARGAPRKGGDESLHSFLDYVANGSRVTLKR